MGWRFRKRLTFGGLRLNLSRRGIGYSWGLRPFRMGVSSDGRKYVVFTIPWTGLSWMKYLKAPVANPHPAHQQNQSSQTSPPANPPTKQPWWKQPFFKP